MNMTITNLRSHEVHHTTVESGYNEHDYDETPAYSVVRETVSVGVTLASE